MTINRLNTAFFSESASRIDRYAEKAYLPYVILFGGKVATVVDKTGEKSFHIEKVNSAWKRVGCFFIVLGTSVASFGIAPTVLILIHCQRQKKIVQLFRMTIVNDSLNLLQEKISNDSFVSQKAITDCLDELVELRPRAAKYGGKETIAKYENICDALREKLCDKIAKKMDNFDNLDQVEQAEKITKIYGSIMDFIDHSDLPLTNLVENLRENTPLGDRIKQNGRQTEELEKLTNLLENPLQFITEEQKDIYQLSLIKEGASGTYFFKSPKRILCVIKPADEEPGTKKNPKKTSAKIALRTGIPAGTNYKREIAISQLDHQQFASVPHTTNRKKVNALEDDSCAASLQEFIPESVLLKNLKREKLDRLPVEDIHRMGILDLRVLNTDRHFGNALVDWNNRVIPIDHGTCLPCNARRLVFEWMTLEQSREAFSEECLTYIDSIDFEEDAKIMRNNGIEEEAIARARVATALLKKGAAAGLTLHEMGEIFISGTASITNKWRLLWNKNGDSYFEKTIFPLSANAESLEDFAAGVIEEYLLL